LLGCSGQEEKKAQKERRGPGQEEDRAQERGFRDFSLLFLFSKYLETNPILF
jgi:hypothetical protein